MANSKHRSRAFLACCCAALLLTGCGSTSGPQRIGLSGSVKSASGGDVNGSINFAPAEGTDAPSANTAIVNGEYHFDAQTGPVAGKYEVSIIRKVEGSAAAPAAPGVPTRPQTTTETFPATVTADRAALDFDVK